VISDLNQTFTGSRAFSFRNELADQWYELSNPDESDHPMLVGWQSTLADFRQTRALTASTA